MLNPFICSLVEDATIIGGRNTVRLSAKLAGFPGLNADRVGDDNRFSALLDRDESLFSVVMIRVSRN